jgi:2-keto-4-pentenoate hydratase/2-oxohepta-3-ene-1,7-dioic acid hydratase in catechol pathway
MNRFHLRLRSNDSVKERKELEAGKVICLAQNYPKHAHEMKSTPPALPYFFIKPTSALIHNGQDIILPSLSNEVHHEVELAVIIGKQGKNIPEDKALSYVLGYAVFLDLTARDIQTVGKKTSRPFGIAKSFDTFGPISDITLAREIQDPNDLMLHLEVNGEIRQHCSTDLMLFRVPYLISFLSQVMTLEPGDIIATGTPHGVSEVKEGESVYANIDGVGSLRHRIVHE